MWDCFQPPPTGVVNDCAGISLSFASYDSASGLANAYFEVAFTGSVAKDWVLGANGGSTGPVKLTASKASFALQDLTNDYSWDGSVTTLTDWPKVALFRSGELVFGTPP